MTLMEKTLHPDAELIEALGGTSQVAFLCDIKSPSVSEWKRNGIPKSQRNYLRLAKPEIVGEYESGRLADDITSTPAPATQAKAA
jgi:hypothetical protein